MANDDQGFSIQLFEIGKIFGESPLQKKKGKKKKKKEKKSVVNEFTLEIQKKKKTQNYCQMFFPKKKGQN
jgi:hypothetical protein